MVGTAVPLPGLSTPGTQDSSPVFLTPTQGVRVRVRPTVHKYRDRDAFLTANSPVLHEVRDAVVQLLALLAPGEVINASLVVKLGRAVDRVREALDPLECFLDPKLNNP